MISFSHLPRTAALFRRAVVIVHIQSLYRVIVKCVHPNKDEALWNQKQSLIPNALVDLVKGGIWFNGVRSCFHTALCQTNLLDLHTQLFACGGAASKMNEGEDETDNK